jgi:F-type H+-transporting ATPase subunit b
MLRQALIWLLCMLAVPASVLMASDPAHTPDSTANEGGSDIFAGDWILVILTLAVFVVLLAILGKWAWGPILSGLQKREEYIRQSIDDAEKAKVDAENSLAQYKQQLSQAREEALAIIEKGRSDAVHLADELKLNAKDEAQKLRTQAQRDIDSAKDQALKEIYQQTTELATDIAAGIISKSLNPDDHRMLLQEALSKLQQESNNQ